MAYFLAALILGAIVFVHEYGHYMCARMTDTPMTRFSIGFGWRVFACSLRPFPLSVFPEQRYIFNWINFRGKENARIFFVNRFVTRTILSTFCFLMGPILWEIRILPLGGFVDPVLSREKPKFFRDSLVILGGPVANLLFSLFVLTLCRMEGRDLEFVTAFQSSAESLLRMTQSMLPFLSHPFGASGELSGPVGIVTIGKAYVEHGWLQVGYFAATISFSLGFMNLLPISPLDGGQFLFICIRTFFPTYGPRIERAVHVFGSVALLGLFIGITVHDISRLF